MTEKEFNKMFADNLTYFLNLRGMSQLDLSKKLGISQMSVSNWCRGEKLPRMDKVDKMCEVLSVKRSDLLNERSENNTQHYIDPATAAMAQEISENPELHMLFSALKDSSPEDLKLVADMVKRFKGID